MEEAEQFLKSLDVTTPFNGESGEYPYALWCPPLKGKLVWICANDEENRITSVFHFAGNEEEKADRHVSYVESPAKAKEMKDELLGQGWQLLKPPKIVFQMGDTKVEKEVTQLNRQEKRLLARELKKNVKK